MAIALIICAALMTVFGLLFRFYSLKFKKTPSVVFKSLTTFSAACTAFYAYALAPSTWMLLTVFGITVSAFADAVICYSQIGGILAFMAAHFAFIPAFLIFGGLSAVSIAAGAVFAVCIVILFFKLRPLGKLAVPGILYAAVIGTMFSLAVPAAFGNGVSGILIAVGATLFVFSDSVLTVITLRGWSERKSALCLTTYFSAQLLFAAACVFA